MEAQEVHNMLCASWSHRKASVVLQSKMKLLEPGETMEEPQGQSQRVEKLG